MNIQVSDTTQMNTENNTLLHNYVIDSRIYMEE